MFVCRRKEGEKGRGREGGGGGEGQEVEEEAEEVKEEVREEERVEKEEEVEKEKSFFDSGDRNKNSKQNNVHLTNEIKPNNTREFQSMYCK